MNLLELRPIFYNALTFTAPSNKNACEYTELNRLTLKHLAAQNSESGPRNSLRAKIAAAIALSTVTGLLLITPSPAWALVGGKPATEDWLVRVVKVVGNEEVSSCAGTAVNNLIVVTVEHCQADAVIHRGLAIRVASRYPIAGSDIQVLLLDDYLPVTNYPILTMDYTAVGLRYEENLTGVGYTYKDGQKKSFRVRLDAHTSTDEYDDVMQVTPLDGVVFERGDSGGPLTINGELVGIMSGKYNNGMGEYMGLAPALSKIRQLQHAREMRAVAENNSLLPSLSAVNVKNGQLAATMSSESCLFGSQV